MGFFWSSGQSGCNTFVLVSTVKDPVHLRHFGKREILAKIDLMEDRFGVPVRFDPDHIPVNTTLVAAGVEVRSWGYEVAMFSATRGHRREVEMPSLMADMYGFSSKEMSDTKAYLRPHGNYQLQQVSVTQLVRL